MSGRAEYIVTIPNHVRDSMRWSFVLVVLGAAIGTAHSGLAADDDEVIQAIREAGGLVMNVAADSEDREVAFHLAGARIGDEHVRQACALKNVIWLNLAGTSVTDAGLSELAKLSRLQKLHLERTGIGDAGMSHLRDLKELEYLNLYGTKVGDEGLQQLEGLTNLRKLYVWQSAVTPDGIAALKAKLPELEIVEGAKLEPPPPPPIPAAPHLQVPTVPSPTAEKGAGDAQAVPRQQPRAASI
jgi:hypothetical protein